MSHRTAPAAEIPLPQPDALVAAPGATGSLLDRVRTLPGLTSAEYGKRSLIALSHVMEDRALEPGGPTARACTTPARSGPPTPCSRSPAA